MNINSLSNFSDKPTDELLHINSCGSLLLNDKDYHIVRTKGRSDYLLVFLAKGTGHIFIEGKEYIIKEKQAFIFHPNEPQSYHFYKKENPINYFIHFNGTYCEKLISSLGLEKKNVLMLNNDTAYIEQLIYRLCCEFIEKKKFYDEICSGLLITILSQIGRSLLDLESSNKVMGSIEKIISEFHCSPQQNFNITQLAEKFSMSPNHLIRQFKKGTGLTPLQYMIDFRLKKAQELLLFSNYSITEISDFLGYENPSYFSRIFKKHFGISPLNFRANKTERIL